VLNDDEQEENIPPSSEKKKKESEEPSKYFYVFCVNSFFNRRLLFLEAAEKGKADPVASIVIKNKHLKQLMAESRLLLRLSLTPVSWRKSRATALLPICRSSLRLSLPALRLFWTMLMERRKIYTKVCLRNNASYN
jgi:hypothetical protein